MIRNGKQYAVVIFKTQKFAPCTGCPFYHTDPVIEKVGCTAREEGFKGCVVEAHERGLKNRYSLTYREVNQS